MFKQLEFWWRHFKWEQQEPWPYLLSGISLYPTAPEWNTFKSIHDAWKKSEP